MHEILLKKEAKIASLCMRSNFKDAVITLVAVKKKKLQQ